MNVKNYLLGVVLGTMLLTSVHAVPRGLREVAALGLTAVAAMTFVTSTVPGEDTDGLRVLALAELAGAAWLAHERTSAGWQNFKAMVGDLWTGAHVAVSPAEAARRNALTLFSLAPTAEAKDIKKAYKRLALRYHPDKNNGNDTEFKKINNAYEELKNHYPELK
jgi:hypothetical protein